MKTSTVFGLALAACVALSTFGAVGAESRLSARTGTLVTPRNFPNHSAEDVVDMFRLDAELGSFAVIRLDWSDPKRFEAAQAMVALAQQRGLDTVLEVRAFKADELKGAVLDPPKDVVDMGGGRPSFRNSRVADAFGRSVLELAQLKPTYLAVATDVNLLEMTDRDEFAAFARIYGGLYARIKQESPDTRVFVAFQWDALQRGDGEAGRRLVNRFRPQLDLLAFSSDPRKLFERQGPRGMGADYYERIGSYRAKGDSTFVEVTWPSDGGSGEAEQAEFVRELPGLMSGLKPSMLAWAFLHDVKVLVLFTARMGLIRADGRQKPAFEGFREISTDRSRQAALTPVATTAPRAPTGTASREPAHFAVYTAKLDGSDMRTIISSNDQEMTHPRVSPDGRRIVLTRYNKRGGDRKATEQQGYEDTEILIVNLDGTGLETIIPMKKGIIAANGAWSPDGNSLIFLSTDNPQRSPEIKRIDLATRKITRMPTPAGLKTTDPHWEAGKVVFPVKAEGLGADALWVMNADGSDARQVTRPPRSSILPGLYGDFDPKLSPDGSKVAFMRIDGGDSWRVMVLDLAAGKELLLTPKGVIEWLPTWSSDGRLLLYVHIDRSKPKEIGLYVMTPDGRDRRMVPLRRGYLYGHSSWFPNDGSSQNARIIFNGTVNPAL